MAKADFDIFVSYARQDAEQVYQIVDALKARGITFWLDRQELMAGELWQDQIAKALGSAKAILAFLSDNSSKSQWVLAEVQGALAAGANVIPVLLPQSSLDALPTDIQRFQILDMNELNPATAIKETASRIAGIIRSIGPDKERTGLDERRLGNFARAASKESGSMSPSVEEDESETPSSVFVVHGHDEQMLKSVCEFLEDIGVFPIVLRNEDSGHTTLIQKFMDHGKKAKFAVVLISTDDVGAGLFQYDDPEVKERALQFRARQNVVLELGFFYGLLSFEHVFVLEKKPHRRFPNFERPSDLDGILFNSFEGDGVWRTQLREKLIRRGFRLQHT